MTFSCSDKDHMLLIFETTTVHDILLKILKFEVFWARGLKYRDFLVKFIPNKSDNFFYILLPERCSFQGK